MRNIVKFLTMVLLIPVLSYPQASHEMIVPDCQPILCYLNNVVMGDTTATGARIDSQRVYVLVRNGIYLSNDFIRNVGWKLTIKATNGPGDKPVVYYQYGGGIFDVQNDFSISNVSLVGYFEFAVPDDKSRMLANLIQSSASGCRITVDSCVLSSASASLIRTDLNTKLVKVTNTTLAYGGNLWSSNIGVGRGIDIRDVAIDTLIVQNCAFVNFTDRIIRHYSSSQTQTQALRYFLFDHNTVVNCLSYHGHLALGNVIGRQAITNNLFVDNFVLGNDSTDVVRLNEFGNSGELGPTGRYRMCLVSSTPNDSSTWVVKNNFYVVTPALQRFWDSTATVNNNPGIQSLIPLTWFINKKNLPLDSTKSFIKDTNLVFTKSLPTPIKFAWWYNQPPPVGPNKQKANIGFANGNYDFERHYWDYFTDTLNLRYNTNAKAYSGGAYGLPAGDLRWWPPIIFEPDVKEIVGQKLPAIFSLGQNFPNPFNPTTAISYSLLANSQVRLTVYDMLGREVTTLVNEQKPAGIYSVEWNASNFSSGIYFYSMIATPLNGGSNKIFSRTNKLMLIK